MLANVHDDPFLVDKKNRTECLDRYGGLSRAPGTVDIKDYSFLGDMYSFSFASNRSP